MLPTRSALECAILLFVCSVWTPAVLLSKQPEGGRFTNEALALLLSGATLAFAFYWQRAGELPPRWRQVVRPTSIDSGLLYGTSLVSMSFAAHLLRSPQDDHQARLNFWCSMANNINFGWTLMEQWGSSSHGGGIVPRLRRCLVSAVLVMPLTGAANNVCYSAAYLVFSVLMSEVCLVLVMRGLQKSFTLGEALLVVQYVGLATTDAVFYAATLSTSTSTSSRKGVDLAVQYGVLGCIWLAVALAGFFQRSNRDTSPVAAIQFYATCTAFLTLVVSPLAYWVLGQRNPIWFVRDFTFSTFDHVYLLAYWAVVLAVALPLIHSQVTRLPLVVIRKLYHILALVMFAPAIHYTRDFLALGFGVATGLALLIEYVRAGRVPPVGAWFDYYLRAYTDDRDDGLFILTHLYLLVGCAVSVWAVSDDDRGEGLAAYGGVLVLGAGDAAAAIVGSQFGRTRWLSGTSKKTVEGTVSGVAAVLLASELVIALVNNNGHPEDPHRKQLMLACAATLFLEAFTTQIDNLVLPIVFTSLLRLY